MEYRQARSGDIFPALVLVLLTAFPLAILVGETLGSYTYLYICLVSFLVVTVWLVSSYLRVVALFLCFYLSIGLLNISSWRGYITIEVINLYAWAVYLLFAPILLFCRTNDHPVPKLAEGQRFTKIVILSHLMVALLAVLYIYGIIGNVLLSQSLRFRIPTGLEYVVKSVLPIAAVLPFLTIRRKFLVLLAVLMPAVMIGSRGTAVVAILAYILASLHVMGGRFSLREFIVENRRYLYYMVAALLVIVVLFYLRRSGQSALLSVDAVIAHYFDYDNWFVRSILPFYLGFKETTGLTTKIVSDGVVNSLNPNPLFFADLYTVLPGTNLAAGQTVAQIFGATEAGGLTPGMLGGLYIDYGVGGLVVFMVTGLMFAWLHRCMRFSPYFIVIYAQVITQFVHLFHRGFLKPEYVTSVLIAAFYFFLCYRFKLNED